MKKTIPFYVIILVLVAMLFLQRECHRCPEVTTITTTDTIPGDSVPYVVEVDKPVPSFIDTGSWHYFDVDTMAILKDYFARVIYLDTLKDDSSAFIAIADTLFMNRLQKRSLIFQNRRITQIINNVTNLPEEKENLKFYAGAMLAMQVGDQFDIGPSFMMITPRGYGYSYSYGINEKTHTLSVLWKIRLKRNSK